MGCIAVYPMGALTGRDAGRKTALIPWSFEPAGLQATLNKLLKGRGRVSPAENFFRPVFCWLKEASMSASKSASADRKYRPETRLVHAGTLRSQFGEMS